MRAKINIPLPSVLEAVVTCADSSFPPPYVRTVVCGDFAFCYTRISSSHTLLSLKIPPPPPVYWRP